MAILEVWRSIPEAPYFAVSNRGRVQNLLSGEVLAQEIDEDEGYLGIYLTDANATYFFVPIDVLVVEAFLGPVDGLEGIDHRDGDPWNNEVWNLVVTDAYWRCKADDCE